MNNPLVIPLLGVACHVCGYPADWFVSGMTLPCRCTTPTCQLDVDEAKAAALAYAGETERRIRDQHRREEVLRNRMSTYLAQAQASGQLVLPMT